MSKIVWWRITRIGGSRAHKLGMVRAPNAEAARKAAFKEYDITDPEEQRRIAAMADE